MDRVCVRERGRERERDRQTDRQAERLEGGEEKMKESPRKIIEYMMAIFFSKEVHFLVSCKQAEPFFSFSLELHFK
jgi:hypothetical protein